MNVLGFSGIARGRFYEEAYGLRFVGHDSAAALVQDGRVLCAVEEERLSRRKHTSELPVRAIEWVLRTTGMTLEDVDAIAYTWRPDSLRIAHMYLHHPTRIPMQHWPELGLAGHRVLRDLMSPRTAKRSLKAALQSPVPRVRGVTHHLTHAACAFFSSPFEESAILTVDGQGEDESATLGEWTNDGYTRFQSVYSPDSIGILYGMMTDFLGMRAAWDEYKVMAMAALGDPDRFAPHMDSLVRLRPNGRYRTHRTAMVFKPGYCDRMLRTILGVEKRDPKTPLAQVHFDIAAALQRKLEDVLFHMLRHLRTRSRSRNLCLAGGVFLNSVANGKIRSSGLFDRVHVPPVPGDHGGALGAAIVSYYALSGSARRELCFTPFLGPEFSEQEIEDALREFAAMVTVRRPERMVHDAARLLANGGVVAWFQGRLEYGPRALGHRSILADPTRRGMKNLVNKRIKHREEFRPFAAAVPAGAADRYFEITGESPYMQFVVRTRSEAQDRIPSVVHNGATRVQTVTKESDPLFFELLCVFGDLTGVPVLLNTSLNDNEEPIVCSPREAIRTFLRTDLDAIVIGPFIVSKPSPNQDSTDPIP